MMLTEVVIWSVSGANSGVSVDICNALQLWVRSIVVASVGVEQYAVYRLPTEVRSLF